MRTPRRLSLAVVVLAAVLGTGSTALAAVSSGISTYGYGLHRAGYDAAETVLGTGNVSGLHQLWSAAVGGVIVSQPLVVPGVRVPGGTATLVIVGSANGNVYALRAGTGTVVWRRFLGVQHTGCSDFPNGRYGVTDTPAVDKTAGRVYVAGADGKLYSLVLSTGATVSGWPQVVTSHPGLEHVYSAITRSGSRLYVETASYCDVTPYHGRIEEFDIPSHARVHTWLVDGKGGPSGGGIWGQGGVSIDSAGHVYTATGNAMTSPENIASAEAVVRLSASLVRQAMDKPPLTGGDVDFGASPALFQPAGCPLELTVENKSGVLFLYDASAIGSGPLQTIQVADVNDWEFNSIPAYDPQTDMLYVTSASDSSDQDGGGNPLYRQGITAFQVQAAPDCTLDTTAAWSQPAGLGYDISLSPPTVANGVVYYGDGGGDTELAFDAATGAPLWDSGSSIGGPIFAAPGVASGRLYVGAWDNHLYAFGP
jgi:outer membrane protein assembly factor BamB